MTKQKTDYGWLGWTITVILGLLFFMTTMSPNNQNDTLAEPAALISEPIPEVKQQGEPLIMNESWRCVDATSYNQNAYDDNRCTKSEETKYVSDSEAKELDPNYVPGKSGASYYNNQ